MSRASVAPLVAALLAACLLLPAAAPGQSRAVDISAPSAIVVDASTGSTLLRRAERQRRPIASATKLMTALLTLERVKRLSDRVPAARYQGLAVESTLGLRPRERMTVADLLRALLLASANDAAVTLAEHVGGSREAFVAAMNRRARELGLEDTRFDNPIGLDAPDNHSTAADLAQLTIRLRRFPFFRRVVDLPGVTLRSGSRRRTILNRNVLVRDVPWIDGVKTGHTQSAGYVLVASGRRKGVSLVSVVLGTASEAARNQDTLALLRHGFRQYPRMEVVRRGDVLASVPIEYRPGARLNLVAARTVRKAARRGTRPRLVRVGVPEEVRGPIERGTPLGAVEAYFGQRRVGRVALVAATDIPAAGFGRKAQDWFTRPSTLLLGLGVVALAMLASAATRRRPPRERRRRESREEAPAA